MFEYLENHPDFKSFGPESQEDTVLAKQRLGKIAPDLACFIEKFGHADFGDGYLTIYAWVEDLAHYVTTLGAEKPEIDAWVFGDRDGDLFAIDKSTGEVIEYEHESASVSGVRHESFSIFMQAIIDAA